jgi:hypothetical protein
MYSKLCRAFWLKKVQDKNKTSQTTDKQEINQQTYID